MDNNSIQAGLYSEINYVDLCAQLIEFVEEPSKESLYNITK